VRGSLSRMFSTISAKLTWATLRGGAPLRRRRVLFWPWRRIDALLSGREVAEVAETRLFVRVRETSTSVFGGPGGCSAGVEGCESGGERDTGVMVATEDIFAVPAWAACLTARWTRAVGESKAM
jgi:hypothetical protein